MGELHQTGTGTGTAFVGAFADPVHGSQQTFRAIMNAMARPGTVHHLPDLTGDLGGIRAATAAVAATLCDADTHVLLDDEMERSGFAQWLAFNTGAPVTDRPEAAAFAFLSSIDGLTELSGLAQGIQTYPDRSATLIVEVTDLATASGVTLTGPGINGSAELRLGSLPDGLVPRLQDNHRLFPRGLDFVFVGEEALMCLPRSTVLTVNATERSA
ncbi:MAG: phosphonate C-P lyase system protein PhnH [Pseudomonadota bacterium]